jgi:hypothetical protein
MPEALTPCRRAATANAPSNEPTPNDTPFSPGAKFSGDAFIATPMATPASTTSKRSFTLTKAVLIEPTLVSKAEIRPFDAALAVWIAAIAVFCVAFTPSIAVARVARVATFVSVVTKALLTVFTRVVIDVSAAV